MRLILSYTLLGLSSALTVKATAAEVAKTIDSVWFPLPAGFDQKKPDDILGHVRKSALNDRTDKIPFSHLYVFGDSACDTGNLFKLNDELEPSPKFYWKGRFSNGPMWPDYFQAQYNMTMTNYAFGGATVLNSNYANGDGIPDFPIQVSNYNQTKLNIPKPLAVVQFVGNDLIAGNVTVSQVAMDIETQIHHLVRLGEIRHIVVLESSVLDYVMSGYNDALSQMVDRLRNFYPNTLSIASIPIIEDYGKMISHPPPTADHGKWHNEYFSCHDQNTGRICHDPQNYFKFDLYHPSTVPNYNLARILAKRIQALNW